MLLHPSPFLYHIIYDCSFVMVGQQITYVNNNNSINTASVDGIVVMACSLCREFTKTVVL